MSTSNSQQPPSTPGGAPRVVKRYSNRKLYDTVESRYVTLPQIAELVRNGEEVRIIDNNTKEDLTRMTLAQILYEEEKKQSRGLPLAALKDLLQVQSERLITSLKDTSVGKLITRADAPAEEPPPEEPPPEEPPVEEPPAASAPDPHAGAAHPGRVAQFVEQSKEAIDHWQHRVDDQIRTFWDGINPASQITALQAEVRRLNARVEALEAEVAQVRGSGGNNPTP